MSQKNIFFKNDTIYFSETGKKDGSGVRERDKRRNRYKQRERESKSGERMRKERKKERYTDQAGF